MEKAITSIPRKHNSKFVPDGKNIHMPRHEFLALLMFNGEKRCHICGKQERLVVDHSHKSGLIRGLLCDSCNLELAKFEAYLRNPPAKQLNIIRAYEVYYPEQNERAS